MRNLVKIGPLDFAVARMDIYTYIHTYMHTYILTDEILSPCHKASPYWSCTNKVIKTATTRLSNDLQLLFLITILPNLTIVICHVTIYLNYRLDVYKMVDYSG